MNNSVFGKTMESVKNRMELKLTTEIEKTIKRFSKLHVKDFVDVIFATGFTC